MTFLNKRNYSYLLEKDCSVVITGDSLSYNRYDFVDEPRMNAWECPPGMESWSFLLRDHLIRSTPGWTPASSLLFFGKFKRVPYLSKLPFKNEGIALEATKDTDIHFEGCPENMYFIKDPNKAALFVKNGKEIDLRGDPNIFEGHSFEVVRCSDGVISDLKEGSRLIIAGGSKTRLEVNLTGSGSKTAEWLLENYDERVGSHTPDICIMIIGANNRRMNDPAGFKAALNRIILNLRQSGSEIVLISPPHSTTSDPEATKGNVYLPDQTITKPILDAMRSLAAQYDLTYMDLFQFFSGIPSEIWRFDNTHFTKRGNLMLFEALKAALFERSGE